MGEALGGLGLFGVFILFMLSIILPISVYAAQKWAYKSYKELQRLNKNIELLIRERWKTRKLSNE